MYKIAQLKNEKIKKCLERHHSRTIVRVRVAKDESHFFLMGEAHQVYHFYLFQYKNHTSYEFICTELVNYNKKLKYIEYSSAVVEDNDVNWNFLKFINDYKDVD